MSNLEKSRLWPTCRWWYAGFHKVNSRGTDSEIVPEVTSVNQVAETKGLITRPLCSRFGRRRGIRRIRQRDRVTRIEHRIGDTRIIYPPIEKHRDVVCNRIRRRADSKETVSRLRCKTFQLVCSPPDSIHVNPQLGQAWIIDSGNVCPGVRRDGGVSSLDFPGIVTVLIDRELQRIIVANSQSISTIQSRSHCRVVTSHDHRLLDLLRIVRNRSGFYPGLDRERRSWTKIETGIARNGTGQVAVYPVESD